jgi:hypothetical protein
MLHTNTEDGVLFHQSGGSAQNLGQAGPRPPHVQISAHLNIEYDVCARDDVFDDTQSRRGKPDYKQE